MHRALHILILLALVPVGLAVKYCVPGVISDWCNHYGAAVVYEVFWVLALGFVAPRLGAVRCGAIVFLMTCALEFLQLWRAPFLEAFRETRAGAALIGTEFDPADFVWYAAGSAAGVLLLHGIGVTRNRGQAYTIHY